MEDGVNEQDDIATPEHLWRTQAKLLWWLSADPPSLFQMTGVDPEIWKGEGFRGEIFLLGIFYVAFKKGGPDPIFVLFYHCLISKGKRGPDPKDASHGSTN